MCSVSHSFSTIHEFVLNFMNFNFKKKSSYTILSHLFQPLQDDSKNKNCEDESITPLKVIRKKRLSPKTNSSQSSHVYHLENRNKVMKII